MSIEKDWRINAASGKGTLCKAQERSVVEKEYPVDAVAKTKTLKDEVKKDRWRDWIEEPSGKNEILFVQVNVKLRETKKRNDYLW